MFLLRKRDGQEHGFEQQSILFFNGEMRRHLGRLDALVAQGDARGGHYANDPHSHADVYTAIECATAVLAAPYQRERTGRGDHIDVSMAQTMLYVNEHAHDALWDGDEPVGQIRSFRPMDYPVLTAANGESVVVSGHPAENKTFDFYMLSIGRADLIDDPRFGRVRIASLLAPNGLLVEVYERR